MTISVIFMVCLLAVIIALNWKMLASRFGISTKACEWSRIESRDSDGRAAWFCPSCGREEFTQDGKPPPDCGATFGPR